jgi:hypothetical protein
MGLNIPPHSRNEDDHDRPNVHLHTLSTGEPHPLSTGALIHSDSDLPPDRQWYQIQIIDNMVGVHRCSDTYRLMIWDWKTGELRGVSFLRKVFFTHLILA